MVIVLFLPHFLTFLHYLSFEFLLIREDFAKEKGKLLGTHTIIHSFVRSLLLGNLREQAQDYQLHNLDDKVLVEIRIREQAQGILHVFLRNSKVIRREELGTNVRRDDFDDGARTLAPDGDDLVFGRRHACWAEGIVGEDGAAYGLQGWRQEGWIEDASVDVVGE